MTDPFHHVRLLDYVVSVSGVVEAIKRSGHIPNAVRNSLTLDGFLGDTRDQAVFVVRSHFHGSRVRRPQTLADFDTYRSNIGP